MIREPYAREDGSWVADGSASDGSFFMGSGVRPEQATEDITRKLVQYEDFLRLSPKDRLRRLLQQDRLLDQDQERCIRLIAGIILNGTS